MIFKNKTILWIHYKEPVKDSTGKLLWKFQWREAIAPISIGSFAKPNPIIMRFKWGPRI